MNENTDTDNYADMLNMSIYHDDIAKHTYN